jgi:hypothetical protein
MKSGRDYYGATGVEVGAGALIMGARPAPPRARIAAKTTFDPVPVGVTLLICFSQ